MNNRGVVRKGDMDPEPDLTQNRTKLEDKLRRAEAAALQGRDAVARGEGDREGAYTLARAKAAQVEQAKLDREPVTERRSHAELARKLEKDMTVRVEEKLRAMQAIEGTQPTRQLATGRGVAVPEWRKRRVAPRSRRGLAALAPTRECEPGTALRTGGGAHGPTVECDRFRVRLSAAVAKRNGAVGRSQAMRIELRGVQREFASYKAERHEQVL